MNIKQVIVVTTMFLIVLSPFCWAVKNPSVRSPVGRGVVPPTHYQSGLVRSPNPIDRSSNLVVTGNVGGGKHFQGVVPYNAVSDFGGRLGSTTLDSFLRRSAGGTYTGKLTPYYSRTRTVTATRPGIPYVVRPPSPRLAGPVRKGTSLAARYKERSLYRPTTLSFYRHLRPISIRPLELAKTISVETDRDAQSTKPLEAQVQLQTKRLDRETIDSKKKLLTKYDLQRSLDKLKRRLDTPEQFKPQTPESKRDEFSKKQKESPLLLAQTVDVYEQMKQQLNKLQKRTEYLIDAEKTKEITTDQKDSDEKGSALDGLANYELYAKARAIMGKHKTFASFSRDKFNQYLRSAEAYLKEGKYYRAADAYTLASVYKPNDPLAYAGKSHALFAAGEYMSSALFLSRAIEIFPEYAQFKIDIEAMVGDRDKLESRIVDINEWLKESKAAELYFLLSYVYYQMDMLEQAKKAIETAYEEMPEAPAVIVLRRAINETIR